jgi:hypothetical protein
MARVKTGETLTSKKIPKKESDDLTFLDDAGFSGLQDFGEGVGLSGIKLFQGIKDLTVGLDEEDVATMEDWKKDAGESGWGTAGEVVGELAQFAIPGGALLKGAKLASKAKKLTGIQKAGLEAISAGAVGGLNLPDEGETRLGNIAKDVIGSGVGSAAGGILGKAFSPIKKSKEGKAIMDKGGYLTPGQAAENPVWSSLESMMSIIPGLAKGTKAAKEKGINSWLLQTAKEASIAPDEITKVGVGGYKQLRKQYDDLYSDVWNNVFPIKKSNVNDILQDVGKIVNLVPPDQKYMLKRFGKGMREMTIGKPHPEKFRSMDKSLSKVMDNAKGDADLWNDLNAIREKLRSNLPRDSRTDLAYLTKKYPDKLTVRDATASALGEGGKFTPNQAFSSSRSIGRAEKAASAETPLFDIINRGKKTVGRRGDPLPLSRWFRIAPGVPSIPGLESLGGRLMKGTKNPVGDYMNLSRIGALTGEQF